MMESKLTADVVIIGTGVRGLVIAYHLSKKGILAVILGKKFMCAGASRLNTDYISVFDKSPRHYTELSKLSADTLPELNEELEGGFD
jgi:glycine/D-amino acid oxidase-like deaminating enzyme